MVTRSILWSEKLGNSQQLSLYKLHFKGIMHTVATISNSTSNKVFR